MGMVTQSLLLNWLVDAKAEGATHMVVFSDDFSFEYYPKHTSDPDQLAEWVEKNGENMQTIKEIYKLSDDWDEQLAENRCWRI